MLRVTLTSTPHKKTLVEPDGFIRIHEEDSDGGVFEHAFFLEVGRSSKTLDRLLEQIVCYQTYYYSGDHAVRQGGKRSDLK